ncbi:unnamed protein product, partial [Tetraodon nigroviridis]
MADCSPAGEAAAVSALVGDGPVFGHAAPSVLAADRCPRARALERQTSSFTGGLYKCGISPFTECERVDFDNEENSDVETKENQWMGVTVQSQGPGGKVVTCAHLYQKRILANTPQESRDITGRCYVLSQDLTIDTSSDEDGGNWNFCEGRARGHETFGSCQQGLAATFTKDYHYLVFGAPGTYNWRGIVRVEQKNNTLFEAGVYDDGPYEVGDEYGLLPELVPVPANSYLGFSLDSGHRLSSSLGLTVVAGAPRANHSGAVLLLRKKSDSTSRLVEEHIFYGPGLASSFGYDVAVVDLDSDGWQDIVVGAPQFYVKDRDVGGAVYVYMNQEGHWDGVTPVRLHGNKHSMFGLAVENIGDVNQDSFEDLAVGAPCDEDGAGSVFIYHGSKQGVKTSPAQILSGKGHNVKFFGYSLAGNMDLDENFYPDVAVGSLSDAALIFRARPVISIRRDVKVSPQEVDLTVKTCGDSICVAVDACFTYTANPASYNPKLTVGFSVESDVERRKQGLPSRLAFLNRSLSDAEHQLNGTLELRSRKQEACIRILGTLKENIRDKLRSIPIEVSTEILDTRRSKPKNSLPPLMPILDASQPSKDVVMVNFLKEGCGSDHVCQSNLRMEYKLLYKENNQDVYSPVPTEDNIPVFHLTYQRKDLAVQVTVSNEKGDDAYEAKLLTTFPTALSYSGVRFSPPPAEKQIICTAGQNGSQADCELGNPFKRDSQVTFYIILSTKKMPLDTTEVDLDLQLQTTSVQHNISPVKAKAKILIEFPLSVSGEARPNLVSFGGLVRGESAMKTEEEVGSLVRFTFRINNLWKSPAKASLHIHWPKTNKDGKWLLYLVGISSSGPQEVLCSPLSEVNPLKLTQESDVSRPKREIGERKPVAKASLLPSKNKLLSCGRGSRCVVLECPLQSLDGTTVELRSRLWNSTFIEDYALSHMDIVVKASLVLHSPAKNIVLRTPDTDVVLTVSPERTVVPSTGVPWWIILVAVLAGVLILALLVFLLWKCGFFKRAAKDQYHTAYHKAEIHCGFFKRSLRDDSIPRYHAVRIKKEPPEHKDGKVMVDSFERKPWVTTWSDHESR